MDQVIDVRPESCGQCGTLLLGEDTEPERHQVMELPRVAPVVTGSRRHCLWCVACGARTQAPWPATMPTGSSGPRVTTVGYLTGRIGASQREVQEILATLYQTEVSVGRDWGTGTGGEYCARHPGAGGSHDTCSASRCAMRTRRVGARRSKRRWLWISVTPLVTIFQLYRRGARQERRNSWVRWCGGSSGRIITRAITGLIRASVNCVGRT